MEKSFLAIRKFAREQMRPFQKLTHSRCSATSGSQQSGRSTAVKKNAIVFPMQDPHHDPHHSCHLRGAGGLAFFKRAAGSTSYCSRG